jgi:LacI family transcriptional regulator, galactose operon repressor
VLPTMKDVARRAGVSVTTVSHALNGTRFVEPETAERVLAAARELGYAPNRIARGLRTGASRTIGVISPSAQDPLFADVVVGIESVCYERGYEVYLGFVEFPSGPTHAGAQIGIALEKEFLASILSGRYDAPAPVTSEDVNAMQKERALIAKLLSREVDGLILNPCHPDADIAGALEGARPQLALFHRSIRGVSADVFFSDDYGGTSRAVESLLALGHRRIGMVYGYSWEGHGVRERFRAYCETLGKAGIPADPALLANGDYSLDGAAGATARLMALPERPTAILYWSDQMAIAGMDAAREAGFSVPEDLSVVGFDDLAISSRTAPRLSSIRQEGSTMGAAIAARLLDRIEGTVSIPPEKVVFPTRYISRQSVAARR